MEKEMKQQKVETKLTFKTFYGNLYFFASVVMIVVAIAMAISAIVTHEFGFIWALVGVGIAYCACLLVFEIQRSRRIKKENQ